MIPTTAIRVNTAAAAMATVSWNAITTILIPIPRRFIEPKNTTIITTTAATIVIRTDAIRMTGATQLLPERLTAGPPPTGTKQTTIITGTHGVRSPTIIGKASGTATGMTIGMKDDNAGRTILMRTGNGNVSKIGIDKKPDAKTGALENGLLAGKNQDDRIMAEYSQLSKIARRGNKGPEGGVKEIKEKIKAANNGRFAPASEAGRGAQTAKNTAQQVILDGE